MGKVQMRTVRIVSGCYLPGGVMGARGEVVELPRSVAAYLVGQRRAEWVEPGTPTGVRETPPERPKRERATKPEAPETADSSE
jgi:hypothetical protein